MKHQQHFYLRFFLGAELILVTFFYLFSSNGLFALKQGDMLNKSLLEDIKHLEAEITKLTQELNERTTNPFYKESIARKELQMAYPNETMYLLPKKG